MGTKWCCSGFREPENRVYADPDAPRLTDVRQFVEESLSLEVGAEMDPVADTFRGVENLNGVFNWEGPDGSSETSKQPQHEWRHLKVDENYGKDHAVRARLVLKDADPEWVHSSADGWVKQGEPQRKRLFSFFWKILPQKATNKNAVELIDFARDLGNEECVVISRTFRDVTLIQREQLGKSQLLAEGASTHHESCFILGFASGEEL